MPVGFGRKSAKSNGRPLVEMVHLKHSIIEVKAKTDCLAHALIIAIARITNDPNYNSYRRGRKIFQKFQHLLQTNEGAIRRTPAIPRSLSRVENCSLWRPRLWGYNIR